MTQQNFGQLLGLSLPKIFESKHGVEQVSLPNLAMGVELEIEGWTSDENRFGGFSFEHDGSLRGAAIEAITSVVRYQHINGLLRAFFNKFSLSSANYSDRTSVHVHVNVLDLTPEQLSTVCLVYQTVERLLLNFVGENRGHNIFCVPWYQAGVTFNLAEAVADPAHQHIRRWQKYTALNLAPVQAQGSIEFRHMHGTCDMEKLSAWFSMIAGIMKYGSETPLQIVKEQLMAMNTVSNYGQWLAQVFQEATPALMKEGYEEHLSHGVMDSKLMLLMPSKKAKRLYRGDEIFPGELAAAAPRRTLNSAVQGAAAREAVRWSDFTPAFTYEERPTGLTMPAPAPVDPQPAPAPGPMVHPQPNLQLYLDQETRLARAEGRDFDIGTARNNYEAARRRVDDLNILERAAFVRQAANRVTNNF